MSKQIPTTLALLALTMCTAEEPGGQQCGSNENLVPRACDAEPIDVVLERGSLGEIVIDAASGGYKLVANDAVDFRYGVVYVENNTGKPLDIGLWPRFEDSSGSSVSSECAKNLAVADGARAWVTLDGKANLVNVRARESIEGSFQCSELAFVGQAGIPWDADDSDPTEPPPPTWVTGNVVELNCVGIRRFDDDDMGVFRNYVTRLADSEPEPGSGGIEVRNSAAKQTYCVYGARLAPLVTTPCPDWLDPATYDWDDLLFEAEVGASQSVADDYVALGFLYKEGETNARCPNNPSASFANATDLSPDSRKLIRITDTAQNVLRFEEVEDCTAGEHVPVAVPLSATACDSASQSWNYSFYNCTNDAIEFTNPANANETICMVGKGGEADNCSAGSMQLGALAPFAYSSTTDTLEILSWNDNGDPTAILKKKGGSCD